MTSVKKPIIISFDGNIGSGKSSAVQYFKQNFEKFCNLKTQHYKVCFLDEPVEQWEFIIDIEDGKNAIQKFYEDNEKYAFPFQMMAYISRLSLFKQALKQDYDIIFTERSMFTDKNVFAQMLYDSKKMNTIEYQIYLKWFDEFLETINTIKTVYIRTIPEICAKRVLKRARLGENIPLDYLKDCHYYHDKWLNDPSKIEEGKVLVIDGNEETNTSVFIENKYYEELMEKVFKFM
jgi:deoxyadenosine/deoxycytidine kinase